MTVIKLQPEAAPGQVNGNGTNHAKAWAQEKLSQMTLEEKVLLLSGEDLWRTHPIPRLGISRIKTSDGPVGVRGGIFTDGVSAASAPTGVSLAATWDKQVIKDVCQVLIAEAKSKEVDVLLGPTVCIPRTPLGGRNFEAYSEDPFLTGKLAATFINTIQEAGIGTCVKHFVANDQETRRFFIDEKIPDRALREIALQPFQIAIRDKLLYKTGKSSIPDWKEGQEKADDLPEHRKILRRAATEGIVLLKNSTNILPLSDLNGKTIAVIGPNAARSVATGGGSSNLAPHYRTTPYQSIKTQVMEKAPTAKVQTHAGILTHRYTPLVDPAIMRNPETGKPGFLLSFYRNMSHSGEPFMVENRPSSHLVCYDGLPPELTTGERYSYRGKSIITPKTTGLHEFSLSSCGPGKLILDGKVLINIDRHWWSPKSALFMSYGSPEERVQVHMQAGKEYEVVLESISREPKPYDLDFMAELEREEVQDGGRIGFMENPGDLEKLFHDGVNMARDSDIAIVVVGKDHEWETETSDMVSMDLPGRSNEFIEAVVKANPNTIVVNQTGSPITMPWSDEVPAIIQAWYQGQELGNSLADVLLGATNPSGKLPITFPKRIEDNPSYGNHPGENDIVHYGEGIYSGYRFYDLRKIDPLFPFGAGLSYTTFKYSNIQLSGDVLPSNGEIEVTVDVTNTGDRDGKEIVQFYVNQVNPRLGRPVRELKGWDKVFVRAGETVTARATLDKVSVSYWDDAVNKWVIEGDAEFHVTAAKDSRDEGVTATFRSSKAFQWIN
ncbi:hypothetical protein BHE90_001323 [Fusarium euwallaceae]|uniref:beta-glucosidase n=2 Tax=Fusarium solani species complex TaxID=232080 RepID=A0A430M875_9HYPO|nr:hypothetical protein CEP51_007147 [Fusarium floridanum]RTE84187.1 hypothetical protein BHE90_001323 [Fusarium euwallaceae]